MDCVGTPRRFGYGAVLDRGRVLGEAKWCKSERWMRRLSLCCLHPSWLPSSYASAAVKDCIQTSLAEQMCH